MQGDHFQAAARAHLGLPARGIIPSDRCGMCSERWDHGVCVGGCRLSRASIHPAVCVKGQHKSRRHDSIVDVLREMWERLGGTAAADHNKQMNTAGTGTVGSVCTLASGKRVDLVLFGAGSRGRDVAIDVSVVCVEAYPDTGFAEVKSRERKKETDYLEECEESNLQFFPFVVGAHGGFGRKAKALWDLLVCHAKDVAGRDWRHSWTAMSFSSVWLQKLSIAMNKEAAVAALRRTPLCTRKLHGIGIRREWE